MGAGPVSNNLSFNVVPSADQSSTIEKVQSGANNIHQTTKAAVEDQGFKTLSIVSWGRRIVNKLGIVGYPVTLLLSPVLLPLSFLYDGYRCISLLSKKITNLETPVHKLLPMTAQQVEDAAKLKQEKDTLESNNAELLNEIASRKIEAGQLNSAKAHADQRLVQLQQQNSQLGHQLAQLQHDIANVVARAERQTVALKGQVANVQQEKGLLDRQMSKLKKDQSDAAARAEIREYSLKKEADQCHKDKDLLTQKLESQKVSFDAQLGDKELQIKQMTQELNKAHSALQALGDRCRESQHKLQQKVEEKKQLQSVHDSLSRMTDRVTFLDAENKKLVEEAAKYRQSNADFVKVIIKNECEKRRRDSDFSSLEFALTGTRSEQPDYAEIKEEVKHQLLINQEKIEQLESTANFDAKVKDELLEKHAELYLENKRLRNELYQLHRLLQLQGQVEYLLMDSTWQSCFKSEQTKPEDAEVVKS